MHRPCPSRQNPIVHLLVFPTQGAVPVGGYSQGLGAGGGETCTPLAGPSEVSAGFPLPPLALQGGFPLWLAPYPVPGHTSCLGHGPDLEPVGTLSPATQVHHLWDCPELGIEPASPVLADGLLTTEPPGMPFHVI